MSSAEARKVIVLTGPTASGKSTVALGLSKHLPIEIISADSVQVYRYLDVGANKVTKEQQSLVRHHLIDIVDPNEPYSAGDFVRAAVPLIQDILLRGKIPVIVGGSTMWVQWLVHGVPDAPKANYSVTQRVNDMLAPFKYTGTGELFDDDDDDWERARQLLVKRDPIRAQMLNRNDWYRLRRYLEISLSLSDQSDDKHPASITHSASLTDEKKSIETSSPASLLSTTLTGQRKNLLTEISPDIDMRCFFIVDPHRQRLYSTIGQRCEAMLTGGLLEEVTSLLLQGWFTLPDNNINIEDLLEISEDSEENTVNTNKEKNDVTRNRGSRGLGMGHECVSSKAIGYRQTVEYLCRPDWEDKDEEALLIFIKDLCTATRNYAKRQMQWYRADKAFLWIHAPLHEDNDDEERLECMSMESKSNDVHTLYNVYDELSHWLNVPREEYDSMITTQVKAGKIVSESRAHKVKRKKSDKYKEKSIMSSSHTVIEDVKPVERDEKENKQEIIMPVTDGGLLYSALDPSIRAAEDYRNKALREYSHKLSGVVLDDGYQIKRSSGYRKLSKAQIEWIRVLDIADDCAKKLREAAIINEVKYF